jgi:predicted ATPase
MKLQIKNLGAVKEATLDLSKPLTIFCGDNGTGKTYLAYLINYLGVLIDREQGFDNETIENLSVNGKATFEINSKYIYNSRLLLLKWGKANLYKAFAIPETRKNILDDFVIDSDTENTFSDYILGVDFEFEKYGFFVKKNKNSNKIEFTATAKTDLHLTQIKGLGYWIQSYLGFYPIWGNQMQPVERNAIFLFKSALEKDRYTIENGKIKDAYPRPLADMLDDIQNLDLFIKRKSDYYEFAEQIEQKLLGGQVIINEQGQFEFKTGRAKNVQVGFAQSASIVKTLGALIIFLKHQATKGQLLIIDEPELNLHPRHQITLARIFAQLIQKGLRLLISTHSDYILRELNNLIMLGQDNEAVRAKAKTLGYEENEYIQPSDIGVYVFEYKEPTDEKVSVKALEIDAYGFDVESIDNATTAQNHNAETLYYALKYGEEIEND